MNSVPCVVNIRDILFVIFKNFKSPGKYVEIVTMVLAVGVTGTKSLLSESSFRKRKENLLKIGIDVEVIAVGRDTPPSNPLFVYFKKVLDTIKKDFRRSRLYFEFIAMVLAIGVDATKLLTEYTSEFDVFRDRKKKLLKAGIDINVIDKRRNTFVSDENFEDIFHQRIESDHDPLVRYPFKNPKRYFLFRQPGQHGDKSL